MTELNEEKRFKGDMCMGILSTKYRSTELIATPDRLILKGPLKNKQGQPLSFAILGLRFTIDKLEN